MATTVTIACKLPNGLHLDLPSKAGQPPRRVTVRGFAAESLDDPRPRHRTVDGVMHYEPLGPALVVGGYALTSGVPEEHWHEWLATHDQMDIVTKGLIYALPKLDDAQAKARERKDERSGLEPVNPDRPGQGLERASVV